MTGVGEANPLCELGQMSSNEPEVAPVFCSAVVKLVTMQMQALGVSVRCCLVGCLVSVYDCVVAFWDQCLIFSWDVWGR